MATLIGSFNPKVINSAHMLIYFKAEMFYKKKKKKSYFMRDIWSCERYTLIPDYLWSHVFSSHWLISRSKHLWIYVQEQFSLSSRAIQMQSQPINVFTFWSIKVTNFNVVH